METFHLTFVDRMNNALITMLLRAGVKMGTASLLTVRGRKSGLSYTIPVLLVEQDGQRFLVAPYGPVQWVRNLRTVGTAILSRGRRKEAISVAELNAREAAPVLIMNNLPIVVLFCPEVLTAFRSHCSCFFRQKYEQCD